MHYLEISADDCIEDDSCEPPNIIIPPYMQLRVSRVIVPGSNRKNSHPLPYYEKGYVIVKVYKNEFKSPSVPTQPTKIIEVSLSDSNTYEYYLDVIIEPDEQPAVYIEADADTFEHSKDYFKVIMVGELEPAGQ